MNELNKSKPKKYLKDKMLLISCAIVLLLFMLLYFYFLNKLGFKEEWIDFISISILYSIGFFYGVNKQIGLKKRVTTIAPILSMVFYLVFPILIGYLIFYFKILPFPKKGRFYIWTIILTVVASTTITCFNQTLKYLERRKRLTTTKKEKSLNDL
jgi:hypothetical protein